MSEEPTRSFIKMSSDTVHKLCIATIERIDKARKDRYKQIVEKHQEEMNKPKWYHKWWGKPTVYTFEQAEKDIHDQEVAAAKRGEWWGGNELYFARHAHGKQLTVARRLLDASRHANELYLHTEDLDQIT